MVQEKKSKLSSNVVSALLLTLVNILCFLPIMGKVGFYLDDWATMAYLHFAPRNQGLVEFLKYYLVNDSRVQNRPLEVVHFGLLHWFGGGSPLHYHLFNLGLEILAAYLAYRIFVKVSGQKAISLIAALAFLLHPGHDSTHYWVICSSVTLSMVLYLVSLHFSLAFVDSSLELGRRRVRPWLFAILSAIFFLLSLLNYETLVPLASISVLLAVASTKQNDKTNTWSKAIRNGFFVALTLLISIVMLLFYLKFVMPMLGKGYVHPAVLDCRLMVATIARGSELNLPAALGEFMVEQIGAVLSSLNRSEWLRLTAIVSLCTGLTFWFRQIDTSKLDSGSTTGPEPEKVSLPAPLLIAVGVVGVIASYSVFGLNSDYEPTYYTMVNRINAGATFASSLVILGLLKLVPIMKSPSANRIAAGLLALIVGVIVACFTLTNFGMARPWLASWETQTTIRKNLLAQKDVLGKSPTLLLVNCPRYVMWSPVFDGVWDFGNMLRIGLNDFDVNANVISQRLSIDSTGVKDVARGYECGRYPFTKLKLVVAPQAELIAAPDAKHFIEIVSTRGMGFGFPAKGLVQWQEELDESRENLPR